jgi:hypothetical protein
MTEDQLQKMGFITTNEAAAILSRSGGGNIPDLLIANGVHPYCLPHGSRTRRWWPAADVAALQATIAPPAATGPIDHTKHANGGILAKRIKDQGERIDALVLRVEALERFRDEF